MYDVSDENSPFGFIEVKCPYSGRDVAPVEAAAGSSFHCILDSTGHVALHRYCAQVQGQMGIGNCPWCDFVVCTIKGISNERIESDSTYWKENFQNWRILTAYA